MKTLIVVAALTAAAVSPVWAAQAPSLKEQVANFCSDLKPDTASCLKAMSKCMRDEPAGRDHWKWMIGCQSDLEAHGFVETPARTSYPASRPLQWSTAGQ